MNKIKHSTWVEPGTKTFKGTAYRAKCKCGWKSRELPFYEAEHIGKGHEQVANNPELYGY